MKILLYTRSLLAEFNASTAHIIKCQAYKDCLTTKAGNKTFLESADVRIGGLFKNCAEK